MGMCSGLSCLTQCQHVAPPSQDRKFMTHQTEQFEMELQRLLEQQKDEMKTLELHFLDARQEHKRSEHTHTHACARMLAVEQWCPHCRRRHLHQCHNTCTHKHTVTPPPSGHMNALWEMEQRQKQDRHQQLKQQVREAFHMQRHQMQVRHQKVSALSVGTRAGTSPVPGRGPAQCPGGDQPSARAGTSPVPGRGPAQCPGGD